MGNIQGEGLKPADVLVLGDPHRCKDVEDKY